jgi:hypothetical protein
VFQAFFDFAQTWQIQALPRASFAMAERSWLSKLTWVHQQGGCGTPLTRFSSMAHWLACPHMGQRVASTAEINCMITLPQGEYRVVQSVEYRIERAFSAARTILFLT